MFEAITGSRTRLVKGPEVKVAVEKSDRACAQPMKISILSVDASHNCLLAWLLAGMDPFAVCRNE